MGSDEARNAVAAHHLSQPNQLELILRVYHRIVLDHAGDVGEDEQLEAARSFEVSYGKKAQRLLHRVLPLQRCSASGRLWSNDRVWDNSCGFERARNQLRITFVQLLN